jgi:hypothetical protein
MSGLFNLAKKLLFGADQADQALAAAEATQATAEATQATEVPAKVPAEDPADDLLRYRFGSLTHAPPNDPLARPKVEIPELEKRKERKVSINELFQRELKEAEKRKYDVETQFFVMKRMVQEFGKDGKPLQTKRPDNTVVPKMTMVETIPEDLQKMYALSPTARNAMTLCEHVWNFFGGDKTSMVKFFELEQIPLKGRDILGPLRTWKSSEKSLLEHLLSGDQQHLLAQYLGQNGVEKMNQEVGLWPYLDAINHFCRVVEVTEFGRDGGEDKDLLLRVDRPRSLIDPRDLSALEQMFPGQELDIIAYTTNPEENTVAWSPVFRQTVAFLLSGVGEGDAVPFGKFHLLVRNRVEGVFQCLGRITSVPSAAQELKDQGVPSEKADPMARALLELSSVGGMSEENLRTLLASARKDLLKGISSSTFEKTLNQLKKLMKCYGHAFALMMGVYSTDTQVVVGTGFPDCSERMSQTISEILGKKDPKAMEDFQKDPKAMEDFQKGVVEILDFMFGQISKFPLPKQAPAVPEVPFVVQENLKVAKLISELRKKLPKEPFVLDDQISQALNKILSEVLVRNVEVAEKNLKEISERLATTQKKRDEAKLDQQKEKLDKQIAELTSQVAEATTKAAEAKAKAESVKAAEAKAKAESVNTAQGE